MKLFKYILLGIILLNGLYAQDNFAPDTTFNMYRNQTIQFELYKPMKHSPFKVIIWPQYGYMSEDHGIVTYSPNINYDGVDSFLYQLSKGKGKKAEVDEGIVIINISSDPIPNPIDTLWINDTTFYFIDDTTFVIDTITVNQYNYIDTLIFYYDTSYVTISVIDTTYIDLYNYVTDTTFVQDTTFVSDTTFITLTQTSYDTSWTHLTTTEVVFDTTTIVFNETYYDTIWVPEIVYFDSILIDTLFTTFNDTIVFIDTFTVADTIFNIVLVDSIVIDTLIFIDTLTVPADTFIVSLTDTLFLPADTVIVMDTLFVLMTDSLFIDIVSSDTTSTTLGIHRQEHQPQAFVLHPNYPNPFNPATTIKFELPSNTQVNITVYDIRGRLVITLADEFMNKGYHQVLWNSRNNTGQSVGSGIYFVRMVSSIFTHTIKITLLK